MKHQYFADYITELDKIYRESREAHDLASIKVSEARKAMDEITPMYPIGSDGNIHYNRQLAEQNYKDALRGYAESMKHLEEGISAQVKALRADLAKDVAEFVKIDPAAVDANTMTLLNSGALTGRDFLDLANKFWNNPTMLRLISAEAQKRLDKSAIARHLAVRIAKFTEPKARLQIFDEATDILSRTVRPDSSLSGAMQQRWDSEYLSAFRANMAALDSFSLEVA